MKEKTFSVTYSKSQGISKPKGWDYIFSWDDGEVKTFIVVSLHAALALGKHFTSLGYQDMVHIAPTDHKYVELDYSDKHLLFNGGIQNAWKCDSGDETNVPLAD